MGADRHAPVVVVVAAVIERDGQLLVSRRLDGTHLAGFWEFPGGKLEPGEPHEAGLARELQEELGVDATIGDELLVTEHVYPERTVRLHFRHATIASEPRPLIGQDIRWIARAKLDQLRFPDADRELIDLLIKSPS
jgi:mutator protein MutT